MARSDVLKALGFAGLGAVPAGVGGYYLGHQTGMKRDAETPFSSGHMQLAYRKGQVDVIQALKRQMQSKGARGQVKQAAMSPSDRLNHEFRQFQQDLDAAEDSYRSKKKMLRKKFRNKIDKMDRRLDREMDRYSHDIGSKGRRGHALQSAAGGAVLGTGFGGIFGGKKGALIGAGLGGLGSGATSALAHRRNAMRHADRLKARGKEKLSYSTKALVGTGAASLLAGTGLGYAGGRAHGKKIDKKTPYSANNMQYAYRKGQYDVIQKLRQRMTAMKGQAKTPARVEQSKTAQALDEMIEKLAAKKDGVTVGGAAKMIGIPALGGAAIMGLMAARGKLKGQHMSVLPNMGIGAAGGAAVGAGLTGLIAMGQEIEKADPSGRTLKTVAELAPAVIMAAGAASDLHKNAHVSLHTPDFILGF